MRRDLWLFGYGSLVWRPGIPYAARQPAYVEGFERRFWQGSTDHRGVPGAPGRVVTLVREAGTRCAGVAYRIAPRAQAAILAKLAARERGGYSPQRAPIHRLDGSLLAREGLLYLATADNPNYLGPAPLRAIAAQVRESIGPSGSNVEYVLRLAESLRAIEADDPHVFALERLLRDSP